MLKRTPLLCSVLVWMAASAGAHGQLVAHYPFDADFEDASGLGNHGFPENDPLLVNDVPPGFSGQSLLLEEEQYVLVEHSDSLDITETMTVTAWIKTVGNAWEGLLAKNPSEGSPDNHAGNYEIRIENGSNQIHFLYQQGGVADTAFPISDQPGAVIAPDTWTHIAVTVEQVGEDPGEVNYYTNGVYADTKAINAGFGATNTNPLYIGTRADLFTQFDGNIDDLRIYNTPLSEPEVEAVSRGVELDFSAPFPIAGSDAVGNVAVRSSVGNLIFSEPSEETVPGLGQSWYAAGNPGSKEGVDAIFQTTAPAVPYFQAESGVTWWSGSDDVLDVPKYPSEVDGVITGDNYTVRLQGEILIDESGPIRFLDGVDDFTYFAIDLDRSGTPGDADGEVIINDNSWTNALSIGNGGAPIVEVDFEDIANGGEWLAMEFNMAEGGGGDHGMLYWDALDTDELFPLEQGEGIVFEEDAAILLIPDSHLRSPAEPAEIIGGEAIVKFPSREAGWEINVNPADGSADTFTVENPDEALLSTVVDVDGVIFTVNPLGDVSAGDSFQFLVADQINGTPMISTPDWSFDAATGSLVYSPGGLCNPNTMGDVDGNGTVEFADFLVLSGNFGQAVDDHTQGDIDCNGTVEFADFLVLSGNFGQSVGAASVPEPAGFTLLSLSTLLLGSLRRRR